MILDFPHDPVCAYLDKQNMLGDSLLVAPVFHASVASFYIPEGRWTCFWTGEVIEGPKYVRKEDYPLDIIPVFVRAGTVLLLGPEGIDVPDYEYGNVGLEVRMYELGSDVEVKVPTGKGSDWAGTVTVTKDGKVDAGVVKISKQ